MKTVEIIEKKLINILYNLIFNEKNITTFSKI